ncbi:hypothetical protein LBMAG27_16750 [Bacteroidota bacterium]|nr:hypothetical protein LBMAG27_16750 [Bacteroidota bacterium]
MTVYCSIFTVNTSVAFSKEELNSVFASLVTKTSESVKITTPKFYEMGTAPISISSVALPPTCFGGSNGSINITVSGGNSPYSYLWSTGASTEDINSLTAGSYTVTVHDVTGQVATSTISVASAVQIVGFINCGQVCFGNCNGIADLTLLSGTAPFTYHWNTGATTQDITGLCVGIYSVTVTDALGCTKLLSQQVNAYGAMTLSTTKVDLVCNGVCNGSIDLTVTGGTAPFSYNWSNGATTQDLTGICAGGYSVTVTDFNGCTKATSNTITQPQPFTCSISGGNNFCQGQSSQMCVTSASSYSWSNGASTQCITVTAGGTYSVTVTNANGCTSSCSKTVEAYALPTCNITGNNFCVGQSSQLCAGAGMASYSWSTGASTQCITVTTGGTYSVTVTNANGCTSSCSKTVEAYALPTCNITGNNFCVGQSSQLCAGAGMASYSWSTGASTQCITVTTGGTYSVTVTNANGCTSSCSKTVEAYALPTCNITGSNFCIGQSSQLCSATASSYLWSTGASTQCITVTSGGTYSVTVTNANGCTSSCSKTVEAYSLPTCNITGSNFCIGQSSQLCSATASSYLWSTGATSQCITVTTGGTYSVTVTNANGCTSSCSKTVEAYALPTCNITGSNFCVGSSSQLCAATATSYSWNTGASTQCITVTTGGTYSVTVTNANGCTSSCSKTVVAYELPACSISGSNFCQGQSSQLCAATSSSYLWSTGATSQCITVTSGGTYSVTVTNANGCTSSCSKTVESYALPTCNITGSNFCIGQSSQLCAGAGMASYSWSTGASTQCITVTVGGTYSVTVTNANGCTSSCSKTVEAYALPTCNITGSNFCIGQSSQLCSATASSYLWSTGASTQCITVTSGGTYSVTVTNANGCTSSCSKTVEAYALPTCNITGENFCYGGSSQLCSATASSYLWSTGASTQCITVTSGGTYSVTVTNANGCTSTCSKQITQYQLPSCSISGNNFCTGSSSQLCVTSVFASYTWSTGASTQCITVTTGGTYSVTVTNANGCTSSCSKTVEAYALPTCNITGGNFCVGQSSQLCAATASSYLWSTGATTQCITVTTGGTYSVTVTNANGCTSSCSKTVIAYANPVAVITGVNVSCYGACNGSASVSVPGTNGNYSYSWSTGASTNSINGLCPNTYCVTVTDGNGCTDIKCVTITQPAHLQCYINCSQLLCYGDQNGIADLSVVGGTAPFVYHWNTGATTQDLSGLAAGIYCATVTDANGCTTFCCQNVTQPTQLVANANSTNISCNGYCNGTANASAVGGTLPYSYLWSNGNTNSSITGLCPDTYCVTVTDAHGCKDIKCVTVTQPPVLAALTSSTNVTCYHACNGTASVTNVSGGTSPYSYTWYNGSTGTSVNGLCNGQYCVTVYDAHQCSIIKCVTITQPDSLYVTFTKGNVQCNGGHDGYINITVVGGTAPFSFVWSNGATTEDISNLSSGGYCVTVTDAHNCVYSRCFSIGQPPALSIPSIKHNVNCFGGNDGSVDITVTGGTPAYSYHWSNGATTQDISNLIAGNYCVTVTDSHGCTAKKCFVIYQPPALSVNYTKTNLTCYNVCTGSINLTVTGGTAPYTYHWANGATTSNLSSLCAGQYCVTVYDAHQCSKVKCITLTQPNPLTCSVNGNNFCQGSSSQLCASAGMASYSWNTGATTQCITVTTGGTYSVTVTNANGCTSVCEKTITAYPLPQCGITGNNFCQGQSSQLCSATASSYSWSTGATTQCITVTSGGTYSVTVTNANGCTSSCSKTVEAYSLPTCNISGENFCYGGSTQLCSATASSYLWSTGATTQCITITTGGTYSVTVTNANGCTSSCDKTITQYQLPACNITGENFCYGGSSQLCAGTASSYLWSTGATTQCITVTTGGTYSVTVTNANGCTTSCDKTITQYQLPSCSITGANFCTGSSSQLCVSTASFYSWSTGASTQCITVTSGGTYSVTVTNENGCTSSCSKTVEAYQLPYCNITGNNFCIGSSTQLCSATASSYLWSTGASTQCITVTSGGTYSVTVTNANGCTSSCSKVVTAYPLPVATATRTNVTCYGACNGTASVSVSGGSGSFNYLWSTGATTTTINGLCPDTYCVTVTDVNGCTDVKCVTITQPLLLQCYINCSQLLCNGDQNGIADLSVVGGTAPFTYSWNNGATTQDLSGLGAGLYCATVTDANGCTSFCCQVVTQPTPLTAEISGSNLSCYSVCNGTASITAAGGTAPYSYSWSNGGTDANIIDLCAGTYCVTVYDAHQCSIVKCVTLTEPEQLICIFECSSHASCYGECNGIGEVLIFGGTAPYSYSWSTGETTETISGLCAGFYCVTITDANGCTCEACMLFEQPDPIVISISSQNSYCVGTCSGTATATVTGGTGPFTYIWSNGATDLSISNLCAGTYCVTVYDWGISPEHDPNVLYCMATECVTIGSSDPLLFTTSVQQPTCNGYCNGSLDLGVSGGTMPYNYNWDNGATTEDLSGLCAGTYCVTVTDAHNCTKAICIEVGQPTVITADAGSTNVTCNGYCNGTATISNVSGGTSPYTYNWYDGSSATSVSGLCPGQYCVTVYDAHQCSLVKCVTITEPATLTAEISGSNLSCYSVCNGTASITAAGGTAPYSYSWSNGGTDANIIDLCAGTYCVTVYDAHQCSIVKCVTLTEPEQLICIFECSSHASCYGECNGIGEVLIFGGTAPYSYSWSTGETTETISGLCAGFYCVTITDANGCTCEACMLFEQPEPIEITFNSTNPTCNGVCNGSATASVTGGVGPFTYLWSNGSTDLTINNLCAGTFCFTVTDWGISPEHDPSVLFCSATNCVTITAPEAMQASIIGVDATVCQGITCDGSANLTVTGGTLPYTYAWSNGATTEDLSAICSGSYSVIVTDANGCTQNANTTITCTPPPPPCNMTLSRVATNNVCFGNCVGTINLTVSNATAPYNFAWSNGASIEDLSSLCAGTYSVIVTDFYGCTNTTSATITQNSQIIVTATNTSSSCSNSCCNGSASVSATGGNAPYIYHWSTGATCTAIYGLCTGTYCVTVTDNVGCTGSSCVTISCPPPPGCDGFRTQTQGGYGNGGAPGVYMAAHFASAFPNGLTVGGTSCTGSHWLKLTTAQAVTDFLPSGSTPTKLLQNWTNPGSALNNVFAGQVVTAALSLGFDNTDPNFSSNSIHLKDLYFNTGTFAGWTVQQVFNEANKKLSGCYSSYSYTQLNNAMDMFNQNYDDGTVDLGHLQCTNPAAKQEDDGMNSLHVSTNVDLNLSVYPNPFSNVTSINFVSSEDLTGTVEVFNVTGVKIAELYKGEIKAGLNYSFNFNAENLAAGMYLCRLSTNNGTAVQNIVKIQ